MTTLLALAALLAADDRPNILLIVTDDQSVHSLSSYGATECETPHLASLASRGMRLTDARHMGSWSGAVCLPSRTMIMTGRSVWHIPGRQPRRSRTAKRAAKQRVGDPPNPGIAAEKAADESLPQVLGDAGYATFRTCKVGNSFPPANRRFQTVRDRTNRDSEAGSSSVWHADQTIDWLNQRDDGGAAKPFLIYLGFSHPHDPRYATDALASKYGADNAGVDGEVPDHAPKLPTNWLPEHPFPIGHPGLRDETTVQGVGTKRDVATIRNELAREYACIELIDQQIGRVFDALEERGELDNTYIFFTSDHGIAIGRHGLMGKQNLYEHTWRVPMLVAGPAIETGSVAPGGAYLMDLLPTICDLTGTPIPETVEGTSFAPVLKGDVERIRDTMYGVYAGGTKPGIRAVKSGDWKLVEFDVLDGAVRETQLFNLRENPNEFLDEHLASSVALETVVRPEANQRNLADDPKHAERLAAMRRLLDDTMTQWDDPYTLSEASP